MKVTRFISDYTTTERPNSLNIMEREDGDIEITISQHRLNNSSVVVIAKNKSRLKNNHDKIHKLVSELIDLMNDEI